MQILQVNFNVLKHLTRKLKYIKKKKKKKGRKKERKKASKQATGICK